MRSPAPPIPGPPQRPTAASPSTCSPGARCKSLRHPTSGIEVSRFPELFRCKNCGRLSAATTAAASAAPTAGHSFLSSPTTAAAAPRRRGSRPAPRTSRCGSGTCPERRAQPTSSSTAPSATRRVVKGFPWRKCDCSYGGTLDYNVHRAAVVYTPRTTVIVNPPDPTVAAQLRAPSAADLTLRWALGGMHEPDHSKPHRASRASSPSSKRRASIHQAARAMAEAAAAQAGDKISTRPRTSISATR